MNSRCRCGLLAVLLAFAAGPAVADKPDWAGGGKHRKEDRHEDRRDDRRGDRRPDVVVIGFDVDGRRAIHEYYGAEFRAGKCPPGLAKKRNGCVPPGQARHWARGRPLPPDLVYDELPRELLLRLPPPPREHRYVRVAGDILMIAVGTAMVVDAIEDLGR